MRLLIEVVLFEMLLVLPELVEGGVNGGSEVAGDGTRSAPISFVELAGAAEGTTGGCVADVGVGRGGGADWAGALDKLAAVDLRFLFGWPLAYALLEGSVGGGRYAFGLAIPLFVYTLLS